MYRMLCVATLLCSSLCARADWQYVGGPGGGVPLYFSASETHCYAYMRGYGMFHSSNEGMKWDTANAGLEHRQIHCLATLHEVVYAGGDSGVFVSTNHGVTWQMHASYNNASVSGIVFVRDTLYAMTSGGVFRSHDSATTWEPANDGAPMGDLVVVGDSLFLRNKALALYHFNPNTFEWRHDVSRTWPARVCVTGDTLYAAPPVNGIVYNTILRSVDYGTTWDSIGTLPFNSQATSIGAASNMIVLLGTADRLDVGYFTVSSDRGTSWASYRSAIKGDLFDQLAVVANGFFYAKQYWSTDGRTLTPRMAGLAARSVSSFSQNATTLFGSDDLGVSESIDDGMTWTSLPGLPGSSSAARKVFAVDSLIFASGNGLWRLGPQDTAWSHCSGDISPSDFTTFGGRYFAGGTSGIGRSSDAGVSWVSISTGLSPFAGTVCLVSTDSALIASNGSLFTTTNNGSLWTPLPIAGHDRIFAMTMLSTHDTVYAWDTQIGILRSATHGRTWTVCSTTLPWSNAPIVATSAGLVHAVRDVGIYLSTDGAVHWALIGNSYVESTCTELIEHNGYLFASTRDRGVWRKAISELRTGITEQTTPVAPQSLTLAQNCPNPCTTSSMITFTLPRDETIALDLIDVLGHTVQRVYAGSESAGEHLAMIDTRSLPAGVYYCRLAAAGAVRTIPIAVAR